MPYYKYLVLGHVVALPVDLNANEKISSTVYERSSYFSLMVPRVFTAPPIKLFCYNVYICLSVLPLGTEVKRSAKSAAV